jgi:hypothetical protein
MGVDQPLMVITFAREEISLIQGYHWIHRTAIAQGHFFPQKKVAKLISF